LSTEGIEYAKNVLANLSIEIDEEKVNWYNKLIQGLVKIKLTLSDDEFEFIEYKRHSASHIFQDKYEVEIKKNGKLKTNYRGGEALDEINMRFKKLLLKHGSDKGFDLYITGKLHSIASALYKNLTTKEGV
jgi:hypothetical protein